jgi:hypothetical protein
MAATSVAMASEPNHDDKKKCREFYDWVVDFDDEPLEGTEVVASPAKTKVKRPGSGGGGRLTKSNKSRSSGDGGSARAKKEETKEEMITGLLPAENPKKTKSKSKFKSSGKESSVTVVNKAAKAMRRKKGTTAKKSSPSGKVDTPARESSCRPRASTSPLTSLADEGEDMS